MKQISEPVTAHTHGFSVAVQHWYDQQLSIMSNETIFAYRVTITNYSKYCYALRMRYWQISEPFVAIREIEGCGINGAQPVLLPGQSFTYKSNVQLSGIHGSLAGYYLLHACDAQGKDKISCNPPRINLLCIEIPRFNLILPAVLN